MARKGRDLFEILGKRAGGESASSKRGKKKASNDVATPLEVGRGLVDAVGTLFRGKGFRNKDSASAAKKARAKKTSKKAAASAPSQLPGLGLAVVVVICLGFGFLLGRFTAASGESDKSELRKSTQGDTKRDVDVPNYVSAKPSVAPLAAEKVTEKLSHHVYPLIDFPAANREAAVQAVEWFRQRDLMTTRLLLGPRPGKGSQKLYVVCYVKPESQQVAHRRLMGLDLSAAGVPNPAQLKAQIQKLRRKSEPLKLRS